MKLHYDPETDSLYIELADRPGVETREIATALKALPEVVELQARPAAPIPSRAADAGKARQRFRRSGKEKALY